MKLHLTILAFALVMLSCKNPKDKPENTAAVEEEKPAPAAELKPVWETDTLLTTCESVLYDQDQDLLYVSDINGAPDAKDGNGFISRISMDGKITDRYWTKGLDAPKGMGLSNGKLFVADIDKVREIDVKTGKLTHTYPVKGAKFLNDISTDNSGKVYISDTGGGAIYVLENGKVSVWMTDLAGGPNGLFSEDGKMMLALFNARTLNSIDVGTKQVTLKTDSIDNPDGIEAIGNGAYLVSSWNGMVHYVDASGKKTMILDTRADSLSAADIEFVKAKNLLLVPTFFGNKVMAYEVKVR